MLAKPSNRPQVTTAYNTDKRTGLLVKPSNASLGFLRCHRARNNLGFSPQAGATPSLGIGLGRVIKTFAANSAQSIAP